SCGPPTRVPYADLWNATAGSTLAQPDWGGTMRYSVWTLLALVSLGVSACAQTSVAPPAQSTTTAPAPSAQASRTLVAAVRVEPNTLSERPIQTATGFAGFALMRRLPNA